MAATQQSHRHINQLQDKSPKPQGAGWRFWSASDSPESDQITSTPTIHFCHTQELPRLEVAVAPNSSSSKLIRGSMDVNIWYMKLTYTPFHPLRDNRPSAAMQQLCACTVLC